MFYSLEKALAGKTPAQVYMEYHNSRNQHRRQLAILQDFPLEEIMRRMREGEKPGGNDPWGVRVGVLVDSHSRRQTELMYYKTSSCGQGTCEFEDEIEERYLRTGEELSLRTEES